MPVGESLEAHDQRVGGIVEPAERRADRDPPVMGAVEALHQFRGPLDAVLGGLDHRLGQDPHHRLGPVEGGSRDHHPHPRAADRLDGRVGVVVSRIDETGDAVAQHLHRGQRRADQHVVPLHRPFVGIHVVEQKGLRVGLVGKPARHLERGMKMVVDEAGRPHHAGRVGNRRGLPVGLDRRRLADRRDLPVCDSDRRVTDDAAAFVHGNQPIDVRNKPVGALGHGRSRSPVGFGRAWAAKMGARHHTNRGVLRPRGSSSSA